MEHSKQWCLYQRSDLVCEKTQGCKNICTKEFCQALFVFSETNTKTKNDLHDYQQGNGLSYSTNVVWHLVLGEGFRCLDIECCLCNVF